MTTMEYRNLGKTGLKVSLLSYGAWVSFGYQLGVPEAKKLISTAFDAGVNFFDNAETYSDGKAELIMGQAFKELGYKRSELVVTTKIFFGTGSSKTNATGLSRKHIVEGTKASLERLGMDYVDVLFCHRPDPDTPIEETVRAMNWVIDQGWALYWGTSEWSAEQILEAWKVAEKLGLIGPACEQPQYNMLHKARVEEEYAPLYAKYGLGLSTWSPLASGVLSGKYSGGTVPEGSRMNLERYQWLKQRYLVDKRSDLDKADQLKPLAQELGCSLPQLALAWCAKNPHVSTVITGATKVAQLEENLKSLSFMHKLDEKLMAKIDAILGKTE